MIVDLPFTYQAAFIRRGARNRVQDWCRGTAPVTVDEVPPSALDLLVEPGAAAERADLARYRVFEGKLYRPIATVPQAGRATLAGVLVAVRKGRGVWANVVVREIVDPTTTRMREFEAIDHGESLASAQHHASTMVACRGVLYAPAPDPTIVLHTDHVPSREEDLHIYTDLQEDFSATTLHFRLDGLQQARAVAGAKPNFGRRADHLPRFRLRRPDALSFDPLVDEALRLLPAYFQNRPHQFTSLRDEYLEIWCGLRDTLQRLRERPTATLARRALEDLATCLGNTPGAPELRCRLDGEWSAVRAKRVRTELHGAQAPALLRVEANGIRREIRSVDGRPVEKADGISTEALPLRIDGHAFASARPLPSWCLREDLGTIYASLSHPNPLSTREHFAYLPPVPDEVLEQFVHDLGQRLGREMPLVRRGTVEFCDPSILTVDPTSSRATAMQLSTQLRKVFHLLPYPLLQAVNDLPHLVHEGATAECLEAIMAEMADGLVAVLDAPPPPCEVVSPFAQHGGVTAEVALKSLREEAALVGARTDLIRSLQRTTEPASEASLPIFC